MDAISIAQVTKSFGNVHAVEDLTARVPRGCIYGFLGPNGAGKTTTLRMLVNIFCPDKGRIEILGQPSTSRAPDRVGYMPEERGLYGRMKVRAALAYFATLKGVKRPERLVTAWLDQVGLSDCQNRRVQDLSRGMQQKLQFAVTAIHDPEVFILDEPFSGLDPVNLDLLKGIMIRSRNSGHTVLFSTHMMNQAEELCDEILLINKGRKVLEGTLDEIRKDFQSATVTADLVGDTRFVAELPVVSSVEWKNSKLEIALKDGGDSQLLLEELVGKVHVRSFEEKVPSLHEIFVRAVGEDHA